MATNSDDLLNVRQAAGLLGVHENTIRNWVDSGVLPAALTLPSGYRRFDPQDVRRLAEQSRGRQDDGDEGGDVYAEQDRCLIAITDGKRLPAEAIVRLPPWRAVLVARVADKAGIPIEGGTLEELVVEARRVGGGGTLTWPPAS